MPADQDAAAVVKSAEKLVVQLVPQVGSGHRSEVDVGCGVAHPERLGLPDEGVLECIGDGLDDDETLGGDAALPGIEEPALRCSCGGRVYVGVLEDDERVAAAQLEDRGLEGGSTSVRDRHPGLLRAGEGHRGNPVV